MSSTKSKYTRKGLLAAFLLVAVSMFSLTACGKPGGGQGAGSPQSGEQASASSENSVSEEEFSDVQKQDILNTAGDQPRKSGAELSPEEIEALEAMQFTEPAENAPIATIKTSMGEIKIVLYPECAPKAVENFVTHAKEGYYDGLIFHRVMEEFMIQGGDPLGNGTGGESIYTNSAGDSIPFDDEFSYYLQHFRGALSMANSGANTNGSQFFIVQATAPTYPREYMEQMGYPPAYVDAYEQYGGTPHLDFAHTVFGMVIEGMDVVDAIAAVETGDNDKPLVDVVIESITIENA